MDIIQSNEENMKRQPNQPQPPPPPPLPQKCPRCDSANTKFCYYNNYSLSQPRHFCKACRRYWTQGGTLRNVPIGGGCRKNKRSKALATASSSNEVGRTQLLTGPPTQNNGMISGQSLRSLPPILSSFAAMQALPAVNMGGNMALLQGMNFQPLRNQAAPQQFPGHDDQVMSQRPSSSWTHRYINGGYWGGSQVDGGDQAGSSYGQNQWSMANNNQGFNPSQ